MPINPLTGLPTKTVPPKGGIWGATTGAFTGALPKALGTGYMTQPQSYGAQTIPGYTPDYQSLIANDPMFKQFGLDASANSVSDAASRAAAVQKALIHHGGNVDFGGANNQLGINQSWLSGDITPQAQEAARNNKLSLTQRIEDAFKQKLIASRVSMRQRGASRSGEAGYQRQLDQNQYDEAQYDATRTLLDYISGVQAAFAGNERQRQQELAQQRAAAAERQAQLNPASPDRVIPPTTVAPFYVGPVGDTSVKWAPRQKPGRNPANPLGL